MFKIYITLFVIALVGSIGAGAYYTWNNMQEKIEVLTANNAKLDSAVQTQKETIGSLEADIVAVNKELQSVNNELTRTRTRNKILSKKLQKHDLGVLGASKPKTVEKIINNASDKALRCFEIISGAKLNDKERAAKNGKEFNSECPWLFDDLNAAGRLSWPE